VTTVKILEQMMAGYCAALDDELTDRDLDDHRPESVRGTLCCCTTRSNVLTRCPM